MAYRLGLRLGGITVLGLAAIACGGGGGGGGGSLDGGAGSSGSGGSPFGGAGGTAGAGATGGVGGGVGGVGGGVGGAAGAGGCQPELEVCDGADNDCNGQIDESDPQLNAPCTSSLPGSCAAGSQKCQGGQLECVPNVPATVEMCDGIDNDCDGSVDDNVGGTGTSCNAGGVGVCATGTNQCGLVGGSYQVTCVASTTASAEVCDLLDNDCDGQTDEGNPGGGTSCATGLPGACATGTTQCTNGTLQCTSSAASTEICNGLDDDCDGQTDENNAGGGGPCGCGGVFQCQNGTLACIGGGTVVTYFSDDFADSSKGWTLGTTWSIGPAVSSTGGGSCGGDPGMDHTGTTDNGVAGVVLGGNYGSTAQGPYTLTSPAFDTSTAPTVILEFWRWLNSDYPSYVTNKVEVFNGSSWIAIWSSPSSTFINEATWTKQSYDITTYKNSQMRVRFSYQVGGGAVIVCGGWNVDDVTVSSGPCL